jgi:hypothetical protein
VANSRRFSVWQRKLAWSIKSEFRGQSLKMARTLLELFESDIGSKRTADNIVAGG